MEAPPGVEATGRKSWPRRRGRDVVLGECYVCDSLGGGREAMPTFGAMGRL